MAGICNSLASGAGALALTIALLAWPGGAASAEDTVAAIKQKGVVTVGTEAALPPFEFVRDGKIVGYGRDILDTIVADLGVKLNQLDVPFDGLFPGLLAGKWDFIATTLSEREGPAKRFAMTYPIAEGTTAILKRKGDTRIKTAADFNGLAVGTQIGVSAAIMLRNLNITYKSEGKSGFDLRLFNSSPEAVLALGNGEIDAMVTLLPMLAMVVKNQPDLFELAGRTDDKPVYLGWAARPDDKPLRDYLSAKIRELRDSGKLYQLQDKWFGFRMELPDSGYLPEGAI